MGDSVGGVVSHGWDSNPRKACKFCTSNELRGRDLPVRGGWGWRWRDSVYFDSHRGGGVTRRSVPDGGPLVLARSSGTSSFP